MPARLEVFHLSPLGFRVWKTDAVRPMGLPHTHPDIELNYVQKGTLRYLHAGKYHQVAAGSAAIFWGGIPHQALDSRSEPAGIWITLPIAWLLQWNLRRNLTHRLLIGDLRQSGAIPGETFERWLKDYLSRDAERRKIVTLEIEASLRRIALDSRGGPPSAPENEGIWKIETVTRFMAEHYREPLAIKEIAASVGLHPRYLMRAFKKQANLSLWEYLTRLRVSHAQRLLVTTDLKIIDVALESGFGSVAPFYAAFSEHCGGESPVRFRKRSRIEVE